MSRNEIKEIIMKLFSLFFKLPLAAEPDKRKPFFLFGDHLRCGDYCGFFILVGAGKRAKNTPSLGCDGPSALYSESPAGLGFYCCD